MSIIYQRKQDRIFCRNLTPPKAKIMSSKVFVLENEIKRLNEKLEKIKKKLKIEIKSSLSFGRLG